MTQARHGESSGLSGQVQVPLEKDCGRLLMDEALAREVGRLLRALADCLTSILRAAEMHRRQGPTGGRPAVVVGRLVPSTLIGPKRVSWQGRYAVIVTAAVTTIVSWHCCGETAGRRTAIHAAAPVGRQVCTKRGLNGPQGGVSR